MAMIALASAPTGLLLKSAKDPKASAGIQSLETGLAIAFALARAGCRLSLTEIGAALDLLPSTVHRHLVSLSRVGLVQQAEPNGRYELGPGAAELGFAALRGLDARKLWTEAVSRLRDETELTTLAVVWGTFGPTIIDWRSSLAPVTLHVHLGAVLPITTSSSGHVFGAFFDANQVAPLVAREFEAAQPPTFRGKPLTRVAFDKLIKGVRSARLSVVQGDLHRGISSLSAPVFGADGDLRLALTILASDQHIDLDPHGRHAKALRSEAEQLSGRLGYAKPPR
jgi:DNA-binding IclR family transcriptional regulator